MVVQKVIDILFCFVLFCFVFLFYFILCVFFKVSNKYKTIYKSQG